MNRLDDILNGDTLGVHDKGELKQQIKDLMLELIGEDIDLTPLMPIQSIAQRASGQNQEKWALRQRVESL